MKMRCAAILLLAAPVFAFAADKADDFAILSQKNIFLKDRQPPPDPSRFHRQPERDSTPVIPDPPAKSIVLRGVVIEDNELHAYVEDTRSGTVTRLVPGDAIADGHITDIALDAIAYEQGGRVLWIDVGQNLYGTTVAAPPPSTMPATAPTDGSAGGANTSPAADPALSSIEQRLRERRMRNTQRNSK